MKETIGILLDVTGIQNYVFSSNELKLNVGASQIIEHEIFGNYLKKILFDNFSFKKENTDLDYWKTEHSKFKFFEKGYPIDIGFIGGGNALFLAKDKETAHQFCKTWTKGLLINYPGLSVALATDTFSDIENQEKFKTDLKKLSDQLKTNKRKYIPENIIRQHGITDFCKITGTALTTPNKDKNVSDKEYISAVAESKLQSETGNHSEELQKLISEKNLKFPKKLDDFGQSKGEENYIAIVHIDGNGIGELFKDKDIAQYRKFSADLENIFHGAFDNLVKYITDSWKDIKKELKITEKKDKSFIPIRPIIIGGDDITFVCNGKLGLYLAKYYVEEIERISLELIKEKITSCAGVCIVKTKFPFFQAYKLAEEACSNAKRKRREHLKAHKKENFSWLDYHINYFGFSGTLEEIRKEHFTIQNKIKLLYRPYIISKDSKREFQNFQTLIDNISFLRKEETWATSKIHELRKAIYLTEEEQKQFIKKMNSEGRSFSEFKVADDFKNQDTGSLTWSNHTPYYDMIELLDFYPKFALENKNKEAEK